MKQLSCEMCGGTNLMKQDGVFVCQDCGAKYSVEEAKKMIVEGTVDVTGSTVKVDTSDELANLYKIARRAKDENDSETAERYYEMILQKAPDDWEASFYSVYFRCMNCRIIQIENAAHTFSSAIPGVLQLVIGNLAYPRLEGDLTGNMEEKLEVISEISGRVYVISEMLYQGAKKAYLDTRSGRVLDANFLNSSFYRNSISSFISRVGAIMFIPFIYGNQMEKLYIANPNNTEFKDHALIAWKKVPSMIYDYGMSLDDHYKAAAYNDYKKIPDGAVDLIKKYEPDYKSPFDNATPPSSPSGGCYVATAVYGSYDCPEVWTLRRYRDYTLAETWYGRAFIHIYYAISPTLVKWFGHTAWFKKMWKGRLDRMVDRLRANGIEDSPYEDRTWCGK